jgi:hypothetical protein
MFGAFEDEWSSHLKLNLTWLKRSSGTRRGRQQACMSTGSATPTNALPCSQQRSNPPPLGRPGGPRDAAPS